MEFFNQAITVLQTLVIALGAGLGVWGVINLLEGYGNDNPGAKSQGMKQLMAGAGVAIVGMVLVPLLTLLTPLEETEVFPSSITIILPICLVTLAVSAAVGTVPWQDALPYLFGSAAGGWAAGMWGRKIPVKWLHRGLGILILWGGYRYLC